jgi:hypothetical protein
MRKFTAASLTVSSVCGVLDAALSMSASTTPTSTTSDSLSSLEIKAREAAVNAIAREKLEAPKPISFSNAATGIALTSSSDSNGAMVTATSTSDSYVGILADWQMTGRYRRHSFTVRIGPVPGPNFCVGVAPPRCALPTWSHDVSTPMFPITIEG